MSAETFAPVVEGQILYSAADARDWRGGGGEGVSVGEWTVEAVRPKTLMVKQRGYRGSAERFTREGTDEGPISGPVARSTYRPALYRTAVEAVESLREAAGEQIERARDRLAAAERDRLDAEAWLMAHADAQEAS